MRLYNKICIKFPTKQAWKFILLKSINFSMANQPAVSLLDVIKLYSFSLEYFEKGCRKAFDFKGKADRKDYWGFWTYYVTILCFSFLVPSSLQTPLGIIVSLPLISLTIRRLRDLSYSPWLTIIAMLPVIGFLFTVFVFSKPSPTWNRPEDYQSWWEGRSFWIIW